MVTRCWGERDIIGLGKKGGGGCYGSVGENYMRYGMLLAAVCLLSEMGMTMVDGGARSLVVSRASLLRINRGKERGWDASSALFPSRGISFCRPAGGFSLSPTAYGDWSSDTLFSFWKVCGDLFCIHIHL